MSSSHPTVEPEQAVEPDPTAEPGSAAEPEREVGVGPWPGGPPEWPEDPHYDRDLLAHGDRRNVADRYRYWTMAAIVADLDTRRSPLHVAIENWGRDFNIGSVVRTANAFNVAAVHIIGRRRWNRRGAMVTDRYLHVFHHPDVEHFLAWARDADRVVLGIDILPGSVPLEHRALPRQAVLVFGEEGAGLSREIVEASAELLHITQHGSTRSINAGAAAGIAMWAWMLQHGEDS
ncbi:RNA methyltransferase [Pseudactinotalea sp. HY160]|uniref:TrmH family RNA methyltransferase n=1 Tax=Pseudactinotalea sp. HY160 TaxID=2654490 RepID=UPI0013135D03|nr:RNA methyltransferase [Pseudactinotalea sp. HY160]